MKIQQFVVFTPALLASAQLTSLINGASSVFSDATDAVGTAVTVRLTLDD